MANAKQIHVQAQDEAGNLVFDEKVTGKKYKRQLTRQACAAVDAGVVRTQVVGAPGWQYIRVLPGETCHEIDPRFRELWVN